MQAYRKRARRGFSLVELLAVVLVLAVLAAVAIPLYVSQRRSAAGRACKANLAAIASAEAAYALRHGEYGTMTELVGSTEGMVSEPKCPLTNGSYTLSPANPGPTDGLTITCPNATSHVNYGGTASTEWIKTLAAPGTDTLP